MSNRLTFSLASLIVLIFALAFAAAPVMAQGPTVTISDDGTTAAPSTRGAFKLKFVFSTGVTGFEANDAQWRFVDKNGTVLGTGWNNIAGITDVSNKPAEYTASIDVSTVVTGAVGFDVKVDAGVANSTDTGTPANQAKTQNFKLPIAVLGTLTPSLVETSLIGTEVVDGKLTANAAFSVNFALTDGVTGNPTSIELIGIQVDGKNLGAGTTVTGITASITDATFADGATVEFTVGAAPLAPVRIGLDPMYAKGPTITVPQLPTVTLSQEGSIDTGNKKFFVHLAFSEEVSSLDASDIKFYKAKADGTKSTLPAAVSVELTKYGQVWQAECNYLVDNFPVYVEVSSSVVASMTPEDGLKVGTGLPTPGGTAPAKPTAAAPKGTSRDIVITWKALTDETLIGYQLKVYKGDKTEQTLSKTIGGVADPLTGTTYTHRALTTERGMYFAFTIAGVTVDGVGVHSAKSSAVQVPGVFTFGGEKGPDIQICEGDTETVGKKRDDGTYENGWQLPLAYGGEESDNITYKLAADAKGKAADLPIGFDWDTRDHQLRTIKRTKAEPATSEKAVTYYWVASLGGHDDVHTTFTIHVKPHQLPETPDGLMVSKVDADDTNSITMNKIELTWAQPELKDTYANCIPYPQNYVVYVEKLNDLTGEFVKPSILAPTTPVVKDEYTSVPTELAAGGESPSADEAKFKRETVKGTEKVATQFTAQFPRGIYRFKVAAHNVSQKSHNKDDPTKDMGLSMPSKDFATWAKLGDEEHIVVADPPAAPTDLRAAIHTGRKVTVNWLKVTDDGGAPVEDDADASDSDTKAARDKFYGSDFTGDFGGYVLYQVNQANNKVKRYPEDDPATPEPETLEIADYDHPTYQTPMDLDPGEYVFRVTAVNIAGESQRSLSTPHAHVRVVATTAVNRAPDFGDAKIESIVATAGESISGRVLPEGTDADGDTLAYSIEDDKGMPTTTPGGLTFNATNRTLTGKPSAAMAEKAYTYKVSDGTASDTIVFFITVKSTAPPVISEDLTAKYAAGVTTIESGSIAADGFASIGQESLPDLQEFLEIGGTIGLSNGDATDDKNLRSVVISEILWGLDMGAPADQQDQFQFIELYNTTGSAIDLTGWTLTFTAGRPVPASDIDQVSNRSGAGWLADIGQNGTVTGTSGLTKIVSMYRDINYANVVKSDHDADATKNRNKQLEAVPSGNAKGSWKASTRRSTYNRWVYDSKRDKHFKGTDVLTASSLVDSPFRINEIGNDTGSDNDWIELYNSAESATTLKNHAMSVVTAKGTDTKLFDFKDQDWKVPAKGYVVISTRHPRDTDLAAGKDISLGEKDQVFAGAKHSFVVKPVDLPDDGKFTLILRNAHDKQGGDGHLIDVVATRAGAFADDDIGSGIWPLKATGAPHGNVIDGTDDEDFRSPRVYQRNSGNGRGEKQLSLRGYTGVGYDRTAAATAANGGTPGYDNGALKEKIADSDADVTISEVMLDVGEGRQNLPQWIELYNGSLARAINLNGWKLTIENTTDVETALSATITLGGNINIQPNQTVLIVTNSGRTSDADHFPSNRVINLWTTKAHRDALGTSKRTEQVFSATGFYLELTDKDNKLVDEVGNLDGSRRTQDDPAWALPMSEDEGRRSSLIRVYDGGVAEDGMTAAGWMLAETTDLAYALTHTYYGDPDDLGTPGFRGGGPLPVSLSKFRPERLDDGSIVVRWITESELNNAGFNILRSEKRDGEFKQINTQLIKGQGTTSERTPYEWKDSTAKPNVVYYYQIQDVSLDGQVQTLRQSRLKGNVTAAGKLTTTWGELKALQ